MDVLSELRKLGYAHPAKAPPIPVALPSLGQIGHIENRRGLYLNSALEKHVLALVRDQQRAEQAAAELTEGRYTADQLLSIARLGSDSSDAIRAIKDVSAALTKWDDVQTAINNGKHYEIAGQKASITTVANGWWSLLRATGFPDVITYVNAPGGSALDSSTAGAIPLPMQLGATDSLYLTNLGLNTGNVNIVLAVDVLVAVGNLVSSTTTAINSTTLPRWTGGIGVMMSFEVTTAQAGAGVANLTISYTNQSGASKTVTPQYSPASFATAQRLMANSTGHAPTVAFASGDYGVRSVQTNSDGAADTWKLALLLYKPLILVPIVSTLTWADRRNNVQIGGMRLLTEVAQGSKPCLGFFVETSTTTSGLLTYLIETVWG